MNFKITSIWIPVVLIGLGLLLILGGSSIDNDAISIVGALLTASNFLIYFPMLSIVLLRRKDPLSEKAISGMGIFSVSLIVIAVLLKQFHVPGAAPCTIFSAFSFSVNYIPAWYFLRRPSLDKYGQVILTLSAFTLCTFGLFWMFKLQHWPGARILWNLSTGTLTYIFIPSLVLVLLFKRESIRFQFTDQLMIGAFIAYMVSAYQTSTIINGANLSNPENQVAIEKRLALYDQKNKFIYESVLSSPNTTDSLSLTKLEKIRKLKTESDSLCIHLNDLKNHLVAECDQISKQAADTITFEELKNKGEFGIPNAILIGDEEHPEKGRYSANYLKQQIDSFRSNILKLVPEDQKGRIEMELPIITENVEINPGELTPWEYARFSHEKMGNLFTYLTEIKTAIRYSEMTILNELYNDYSIHRKENLAAQLTELAAKYENEKKEKQISLLEKDKEIAGAKLQAKDMEISQRDTMIFYFFIAIAIFTVLTVVIIRSNYLRKQMYKQLEAKNKLIAEQKEAVEHQKQIIEDKQKEILDSIRYAKRIQLAQIPSDKLVINQINRSKK